MMDADAAPSLSASSRLILEDLISHWRSTGATGRARLFKLVDDPDAYADELGLGIEELKRGMTDLYGAGAAYYVRPSAATHGKWKFAMYKDFAAKSASATTTTTCPGFAFGSGGDDSSSHDLKRTPPVGIPLSHPRATMAAGPAPLPDLLVHPPGRLHRVNLRLRGVLDPQRTHLLREAADKGKTSEVNNRFGTRLQLSSYQISSQGRLRLFIKDPERLTEALEELAAFCKGVLGFDMNGILEGTAKYDTSIEVGYRVSGEVAKYASCKVWVELRGYKAVVFFDKSPGDYELEVHAKGKGPPGAIKELTDMIVVNGAMGEGLPRLVADEVFKRWAEWMKQEGVGSEPA